MQTGWLVYQEKDMLENKGYTDWFIDEAKNAGLDLKLILREDLMIGVVGNKQVVLYQNQQAILPDFAVVRTIEPLLSLHLEALSVQVFNNAEIARICNDKALTHHHMNQLNIPMVDTYYFHSKMLLGTPPIAYPFVVKQTDGRGGQQVYLIQNDLEWQNCLDILPQTNIIIQTCNVKLGRDIRVFIVGKEIVGAIIRESDQDFRANFKLGGSCALYELDEDESAIVQKIVDAFDFGMVGIDFLIGLDGNILFNEIEDIVGSRTLSAVSDINILSLYIAYIKQQLSK